MKIKIKIFSNFLCKKKINKKKIKSEGAMVQCRENKETNTL